MYAALFFTAFVLCSLILFNMYIQYSIFDIIQTQNRRRNNANRKPHRLKLQNSQIGVRFNRDLNNPAQEVPFQSLLNCLLTDW